MKNLFLGMALSVTIFVSWNAVCADPDFPHFSTNARALAPTDPGSRHGSPHVSPVPSPALRPVHHSPSAPQLSLSNSPESSPEPKHEKAQTFPPKSCEVSDDSDRKRVKSDESPDLFSTIYDTIFSKFMEQRRENSTAPAIVGDDKTRLEIPALKQFLQSQLQSATAPSCLSWTSHLNYYNKDDMIAFVASLNVALPELATSAQAKPFLRKAEQFCQRNSEPMNDIDGFLGLATSAEIFALVDLVRTSEQLKLKLLKTSFTVMRDNAKDGSKLEQKSPAADQSTYPQSVVLRDEMVNGVRVTTERITTAPPVNGVDVFSSLRMTSTPVDEKGKQ